MIQISVNSNYSKYQNHLFHLEMTILDTKGRIKRHFHVRTFDNLEEAMSTKSLIMAAYEI